MMVFTHLLVGAATGKAIGRGKEAFLAGLATHLLLDSLPHRDCGLRVELLSALAAMAVAAGSIGDDRNALAGAAGAVLPDLENALCRVGLLGKCDMAFPTHNGLARHGRESSTFLPQFVVAAAALFFLFCESSQIKKAGRQ